MFPLGLSFRAQRGISPEFAAKTQRHHEGETNAGFVLQAKRFLCCLIGSPKRIIVDNDLVNSESSVYSIVGCNLKS